ncbi:MAG: flippase-like domain-containing protein [Clostridia bacterium]|nr:flippase-like domain-containing protein [Clostridia bacterium]
MKKKNKDMPVVSKIEIDKNTAEPIITELSEKELLALHEESEEVVIEKSDFVEHATRKGAGKQIAMSRLGITPKDNDASINKRQKMFKNIFTITFIVALLAIFAWTIYNDFFSGKKPAPSWEEIKGILTTGWLFLIGGLICVFLYYFFKGAKLSLMCKKLTGKFHFKTCFETCIIGLYYNCVTPLAVGGQPFEIYHLSKHGVHGGAASSLPIATFFTNQFALVIMGIIAICLFKTNAFNTSATLVGVFPEIMTALAIIGIIFCMVMPLLVVIFSLMPKTGSRIVVFGIKLAGKMRLVKNPKETTYKTIKSLFNNANCIKKMAKSPIVFISSMLLSFLEQFANFSLAYFALKTFGYSAGVPWLQEWAQITQLAIILSAAVSFIPTPGNSGAADFSFYTLFESSLSLGSAFASMMAWRFLSFYIFILVGFIFATVKKRLDLKRQATLTPLE